MAIMDNLNTFSGSVSAAGVYSGQAVTTSAASTNVIDLGVARDLGVNDDEAIEILCLVMTTFTGGTSITPSFQGSVDNSTFTDIMVGPAVALADLTVGTEIFRFKYPIQASNKAIPRYIRMYYTVSGTMTAGALWAGLILDRQAFIPYPNNYTTTYI